MAAIPRQGYRGGLNSSYLQLYVFTFIWSWCPLCALQCPLQQATHAQVYQLQQQLNQAVNIKQQDLEEAYQVNAGLRLWARGMWM